MPTRSCSALSWICRALRSLASRAPSGSSRSRTLGPRTSARASATRCCWPPESVERLLPGPLLHLDQGERLADPGPYLLLGGVRVPQPERDVVPHRHEREQRVVLEDRVDRALVRSHVGDVDAVQQDLALGRLLEAGDHPQRRGLPAARGPQQGEELPARDVEVDARNRLELPERLLQPYQPDLAAAAARCQRLLSVVQAHIRPVGRSRVERRYKCGHDMVSKG